MHVVTFRFRGYQNYEETQTKLRELFKKHFQYDDIFFMLAVNEAVCNAARYAKAGAYEVDVDINVEISETDLSVTVKANTMPSNAKDIQSRLRKLAENPKWRSKDWGDYTQLTEMSRGFWYMLQACDYVLVESDLSLVKISARIPYKEHEMNRTIGFLVPKFFVRTRGVVS